MVSHQDAGLREFVQIPGPNPIVKRGGPDEWDERHAVRSVRVMATLKG